MRLVMHLAHIRKLGDAYRISVVKLRENTTLRSRYRWEDSIEMGSEDVDWFHWLQVWSRGRIL
jgi:hypothetical protein